MPNVRHGNRLTVDVDARGHLHISQRIVGVWGLPLVVAAFILLALVLLQVVHPPRQVVSSIVVAVAAQLGIVVSVGLQRYLIVLPDGAEEGFALVGWVVRARRWLSKPAVSLVEANSGMWHRVALDSGGERLELFSLDQEQASKVMRVVRENLNS